jgi:diadenosine tetraphosphatase ApaH/serine/threonine PP2A family protein phosphatase
VPYHRHIVDRGSAVDYVNVGSVGKPKDGDPRACWTELILEAGRVEARFHRVSYDIAAVQAAMRSAGLPETLIDALAGA